MKLLNFLAWYVIAVAVVFYLLPIIGIFLEGRYDALASSTKFFSILGFMCVVAAWQITGRQKRLKASLQKEASGQP
jgi:positive regulator of sigma E activity